jgi:hypothetical protein
MKADDMVGLWILDIEGSSQIVEFMEDGTYEFSMRVDRQGVPQPLVRGAYWLEGKQFYIQEIEDPRGTGSGVCPKIGTYEVQMLESGNLKFTVMDDPCPLRLDSFVGAGFVDYEYKRME